MKYVLSYSLRNSISEKHVDEQKPYQLPKKDKEVYDENKESSFFISSSNSRLKFQDNLSIFDMSIFIAMNISYLEWLEHLQGIITNLLTNQMEEYIYDQCKNT